MLLLSWQTFASGSTRKFPEARMIRASAIGRNGEIALGGFRAPDGGTTNKVVLLESDAETQRWRQPLAVPEEFDGWRTDVYQVAITPDGDVIVALSFTAPDSRHAPAVFRL